MTTSDFIHNVMLAFTAKEEGFSIKKMMAVVVVVVMLIVTAIEITDDNFLLALTAWLGFVTSLLITGAVEKNITSVNETKQKANEAV